MLRRSRFRTIIHAGHGNALLLFAYVVHLVEEWAGDLSGWSAAVLGNDISIERFIVINGSALLVFATGTIIAYRSPESNWFSVAFASLLGLNGLLHTLATLYIGVYSPGTVTGLVLYLPISIIVLRECRGQYSPQKFAGAVLTGVSAHAAVSLLAFM